MRGGSCCARSVHRAAGHAKSPARPIAAAYTREIDTLLPVAELLWSSNRTMATDPASLNEYDPTLPETFDSVYETFAELRSKCPVAHSTEFNGFWAVARYDDVVGILRKPETFITSVRNVVPGSSTTGRRPPLHLDPPAHTPYRRALDRALGPVRTASLEPVTRQIARELAMALAAKGEADLVEDFSAPLPVRVFGQWLGLSDEQTGFLARSSRAYIRAWEAFDKVGVAAAGDDLAKLAAELVEQRRAEPLDPQMDPTSSLLAERDAEGQPFPDVLLAGCVRQILVVGLVAPPILIGSIAVHLSKDPSLQQQLRADPALMRDATEEFLRLYTPYRGFARTAKHDVTICGRHIAPNEPIALLYASANRDPEVFPEPDKFLLKRENISQHIAFGRGPHMCAGIPLARQLLRIGVEELLSATEHFEVCGEIRMSGMPEVGPLYVPLRMVAAQR
jgi:cytochrome P450